LRRISSVAFWFVLVLIVLPVAVGAGFSYARGWPDNWRSASWVSAGLLPEASAMPEARVIILSARTGRWKGIFAEHTAIVLKSRGASRWSRYDVVGWGNPVRRDAFVADALWYGNRPYIVAEIAGTEAETLIPKIEDAVARYPFARRGDYSVWPGPNSNSFVAWVVRQIEDFDTELPATAVGKDYLGPGLNFDEAASGTGFVISLTGIVGLTVALEEGIELQIFGASIGVDPNDLAIKLPALGKLSPLDLL
jgi:hypothetical protein